MDEFRAKIAGMLNVSKPTVGKRRLDKLPGLIGEKPVPVKHQPAGGITWYRRNGFKRIMSGVQGIGLLLLVVPGKTVQMAGTGIVAVTTAILGTAGIQDAKQKKMENGGEGGSILLKLFNWIVGLLKKMFGGK
jgi:hypothetical protein